MKCFPFFVWKKLILLSISQFSDNLNLKKILSYLPVAVGPVVLERVFSLKSAVMKEKGATLFELGKNSAQLFSDRWINQAIGQI